MYTQQLSHIPNQMTPDDLFSHVDKMLKPKRWAGILHDHDKKDDNVTPAEDHVHLMMQFDNARSVNQLAKDIGDVPQYFEIWNDNVNNGFAYLVHATKSARHKHQYSCDEVKANFDYPALINRLVRKASKAEGVTTSNQINGILDLVGLGEISLKDAKNLLSGSAYAKASTKLAKAHELFLERRADALHKSMAENNELVSVHWFSGYSETGKTYLAQKLAAEMGDYYMASTAKDPFQYYQAEPTIILDELRPFSIEFSELLGMFNPFSRGNATVSSRYYNKALACRTFFVTSPFSPEQFCRELHLTDSDSCVQLYRRLSSVLFFNYDTIYKMEYDEFSKRYDITAQKDNPYSKKHQPTYQLGNIYDMI